MHCMYSFPDNSSQPSSTFHPDPYSVLGFCGSIVIATKKFQKNTRSDRRIQNIGSIESIESNKSIEIIESIGSHSAPEQWPSEKKTSTPKINSNESVLLLYIDI